MVLKSIMSTVGARQSGCLHQQIKRRDCLWWPVLPSPNYCVTGHFVDPLRGDFVLTSSKTDLAEHRHKMLLSAPSGKVSVYLQT